MEHDLSSSQYLFRSMSPASALLRPSLELQPDARFCHLCLMDESDRLECTGALIEEHFLGQPSLMDGCIGEFVPTFNSGSRITGDALLLWRFRSSANKAPSVSDWFVQSSCFIRARPALEQSPCRSSLLVTPDIATVISLSAGFTPYTHSLAI